MREPSYAYELLDRPRGSTTTQPTPTRSRRSSLASRRCALPVLFLLVFGSLLICWPGTRKSGSSEHQDLSVVNRSRILGFSDAWQIVLDSTLHGYTAEEELGRFNIHNYSGDRTRQDYLSRLERFVTDAFPAPLQQALLQPLQEMQHYFPPGADSRLWQWRARPFPPHIVSTAKDVGSMPSKFASWQTLHPDFRIDSRDDAGLVAWIDTYLPPGGSMRDVWEAFPRKVLQSDAFR